MSRGPQVSSLHALLVLICSSPALLLLSGALVLDYQLDAHRGLPERDDRDDHGPQPAP